MARLRRARVPRPKPDRKAKAKSKKAKFSPTLLVIAVLIGAIAYVALQPPAGPATTRTAALGSSRPPVVNARQQQPGPAPAPPTSDAEAEAIASRPATPPASFALSPMQANLVGDPLTRYLIMEASMQRKPKSKKMPAPKVAMPPKTGALAPWIETWIAEQEVRYAAYIAGARPGAIVRTSKGETVVFAGERFPGQPEVRVVRITPSKIVFAAFGKVAEVKR